MRYFEVHKYEITGRELRSRVYSDGESIDEPEETGDETNVVLFYAVNEYEDGGAEWGLKYYPITTTGDQNNEAEVLAQIHADHPAGDWQNDDW